MANQPMSKQAQVSQLLAAVRRRLRQAVEVRVGHLGLSGQQYWMLETISERGECALGEVLSTLPMDQPTASRVLAALHRRGLVEIESDQHDRRRRCLRLTGAGKRLASRCAGHGRRVRKSVLVGFTSADVSTLTRFLSRMVANLDRLDMAAPPTLRRGKGLAKPRVSGNYRAKP